VNRHWFLSCLLGLVLSSLAGIAGCQQSHKEMSEIDKKELQRALEVLPDNGIVISSPGQDPVVIEPGSREVSALGGKLKFFHVFHDDIPLPAISPSAKVASAGPAFFPKPGGTALGWVVLLEPRTAKSLRRVTRVQVEDVSGPVAKPLIDSSPQFEKEALIVGSEETPFSRASFPWMFSDHATLFILRITLHGERDEVLLQPVLIGTSVKRQVHERWAARPD
jgi:hypothetical protein